MAVSVDLAKALDKDFEDKFFAVAGVLVALEGKTKY